jgi:hypothetical protein
MNEERKRFMVTQLESLRIQSPVVYVDAYTPVNSPEYLDEQMVETKAAAKYYYGLQCCTRSHIKCMKLFEEHYSHIPYVVVLEDDACILKETFEEELVKLVAIYERQPALGYVSIGYFPPVTDDGASIEDNLSKYQKDNNVYWRMDTGRPRVFGLQGSLYNHTASKKLCAVLDRPTAAEALKSLEDFTKTDEIFSDIVPILHSDTAINIVLRHGLVWPPLVVESPTMESQIWEPNKKVRNLKYCLNIQDQLNFSMYYSF